MNLEVQSTLFRYVSSIGVMCLMGVTPKMFFFQISMGDIASFIFFALSGKRGPMDAQGAVN